MSDEKKKEYDEEGRVIRANRSQLKRERAEIKAFAETLLQLPARQFPLLPINDALVAALVEGQRLTGNAKKRHLNYLTRLIEEQDFAHIKTAHEHINHPFLRGHAKDQRIAQEIARLRAGDATIWSDLRQRYDNVDWQHLRQLTREMQKFAQQQARLMAENPAAPVDNRPGKHQRQIQKYLHSLPLRCPSDPV